LLSETQKPAAVPKSATGYGKYTDTTALQAKQDSVQSSNTGTLPSSKTPGPVYSRHEAVVSAPPDHRDGAGAPSRLPHSATSSTPRPATARPPAPPKPKNLRVGSQESSRPGTSASQDRSPAFQQASAGQGGEDWEANFSRRFPSLSGIEMETEIEIPKFPKMRTREV
jgi:AP2-associated kinase